MIQLLKSNLSNLFRTFQRNLGFGRLENRGLFSIKGLNAFKFLQGLVTNDVNSIIDSGKYISCLMLNPKGRVLADLFVYNLDYSLSQSLLIECDFSIMNKVIEVLQRYNIRKHLDIVQRKDLDVWIMLPKINSDHDISTDKCRLLAQKLKTKCLFSAFDPRGIPGWSTRIILSTLDYPIIKNDPIAVSYYKRFRHRLGIPEGVDELLYEESLPLENNADLNGLVSFNKGCYIGQELTARTRFTGVIRRRILPIKFESTYLLDSKLYKKDLYLKCNDDTIISEKDRAVGWVRTVSKVSFDGSKYLYEGLALIRFSDVVNINDKSIIVYDNGQCIKIKVFVPSWWSHEYAPGLDMLPKC